MNCLRRSSRIISTQYKQCLKRCLTSKSFDNVKIEEEKKGNNIIVQNFEDITFIGINRNKKRNSLDIKTAQQLLDELDKFESDENSLVAVLHGTNGCFCSGYDLEEIAQYNGQSDESLPQFGPLANRIHLSKKPVIASIDGFALGVGFELALMCDFRVIEETAVVGFPNRRFGIPILCGGTVRLPALIGYSRALDLIMTGRLLNAKEALSWGLANRYCKTGAVLGEALSFAKSFVKFPQKTLLADRASAHHATFTAKHLEEAIQFEKDNASHLLFEEGIQGAKRFITEGLGKHGKFHNITQPCLDFKEFDKNLL